MLLMPDSTRTFKQPRSSAVTDCTSHLFSHWHFMEYPLWSTVIAIINKNYKCFPNDSTVVSMVTQ